MPGVYGPHGAPANRALLTRAGRRSPFETMDAEAVLIDLDGTLYVDDDAVPGAPEAVARLRAAGVPHRFITNTTRMSRADVARRLDGMGFGIEPDEIFTAPLAAADWLASRGVRTVDAYLPDAALSEFAPFSTGEEHPDAVVVGDLGTGWSFERLNRAFRQVLGGARLIALQRNRYWRTGGELALDAGPFVAALEYATGAEAVVVGKPAPAFFHLAAASLGVPPGRVLMIGDDVETDALGARAAGMRGALVRTGKYRRGSADGDPDVDLVLDSVADLPTALGL